MTNAGDNLHNIPFIMDKLKSLVWAFDWEEIVIMAPYHAQTALLSERYHRDKPRTGLKDKSSDIFDLRAVTTNRFMGSEASCVIGKRKIPLSKNQATLAIGNATYALVWHSSRKPVDLLRWFSTNRLFRKSASRTLCSGHRDIYWWRMVLSRSCDGWVSHHEWRRAYRHAMERDNSNAHE